MDQEYVRKLEEENKLLKKRLDEVDIREGIVDFLGLKTGEFYRGFKFDSIEYNSNKVLTGPILFLLYSKLNLNEGIHMCLSEEPYGDQKDRKDVIKCFDIPQNNYKRDIFNKAG
jgi:hypothetical protein